VSWPASVAIDSKTTNAQNAMEGLGDQLTLRPSRPWPSMEASMTTMLIDGFPKTTKRRREKIGEFIGDFMEFLVGAGIVGLVLGML